MSNLAAYCARIGWEPPAHFDAEALAAMQLAHRTAIPFENLDIPLGRGIAIDSESVFGKLVTARRGGYCFEQNRLYSDMLSQLGIAHRSLLARVRFGPPDPVPPRTHMLLLVELGGEAWIADAGFGGSYAPPLLLADGARSASPDGMLHRLRQQAGGLEGEWLLERAAPGAGDDGWQKQYTFDLAEVAQEDLEQANHWTSTRPDTRFTTLHIASIALVDGFAALTDQQLNVTRGMETETSELLDAASWRQALAEILTIELSETEVARLPLFAG
ncbi:arylamine N-acetyltransferase family protein [Altererythrobacter sp.]|uniref:arylamine N-acetyltransferase family protein n=1 Tax=Altererythrobacter sp. TaxID=1872480 RepID=UPI003D016953